MRNWRRTKEYRVWRLGVIRRDKVCVVCGSRKRRHAHHINNGAHHAEGRFDVGNGVCLCSKCHRQFHTNFKSSYRKKCTRKDWYNFLDLVKYVKGLYNGVSTS